MSDLDALLARAQSGEPGSRDDLAFALYVTLRRYFRSRRPRPTPAETDDLVQGTLLVLVGRIDSFQPAYRGAFTAFVIKTADLVQRAHRTAFARAAARRPPSEQSREGLASGPSPSTWAADRELLAKVDDLIVELGSADQRSMRAWMDEESWRVQVEREGIQRASLRARLSRALDKVRARARDAGLIPISSTR